MIDTPPPVGSGQAVDPHAVDGNAKSRAGIRKSPRRPAAALRSRTACRAARDRSFRWRTRRSALRAVAAVADTARAAGVGADQRAGRGERTGSERFREGHAPPRRTSQTRQRRSSQPSHRAGHSETGSRNTPAATPAATAKARPSDVDMPRILQRRAHVRFRGNR